MKNSIQTKFTNKKSINWKNANLYPNLTHDQAREEFLQRSGPVTAKISPSKSPVLYIGRGSEVRIFLDAGHCLAEFDMTQIISPQIRRFENLLDKVRQDLISDKEDCLGIPGYSLELKPHMRERKQEKYAALLRALDGIETGASFREIWQTIYPQNKSKNPRRSGQRLVEAAYTLQNQFKNKSAPPKEPVIGLVPRPSPRCLWKSKGHSQDEQVNNDDKSCESCSG